MTRKPNRSASKGDRAGGGKDGACNGVGVWLRGSARAWLRATVWLCGCVEKHVRDCAQAEPCSCVGVHVRGGVGVHVRSGLGVECTAVWHSCGCDRARCVLCVFVHVRLGLVWDKRHAVSHELTVFCPACSTGFCRECGLCMWVSSSLSLALVAAWRCLLVQERMTAQVARHTG